MFPGLLAESTSPQIKDVLTEVLVGEGLDQTTARQTIEESCSEGDTGHPDKLRAVSDIRMLFRILKSENIKIAICTSDNRKGTLASLEKLKLCEYIDYIVCGDDPNTLPKPDPHNAWKICGHLNVDPQKTAMVGDTQADVGMGFNAKLGWSIGVLSGIGDTEDLMPEADHVVKDVKDILPLILADDKWKDYYAYFKDDRVLVEPFDDSIGKEKNLKNVSAVIVDLNGTLLCMHGRYTDWIEKLCHR